MDFLHRSGILDVFLSIIAKALTVQVKLKSKTGCGNAIKEINTVTLATSVHPKENLENRWWLKGFVNRKLAEVLVNLIKDMAAVSSFKFSPTIQIIYLKFCRENYLILGLGLPKVL